MNPPTEGLQRISRLAPLSEVLARLDALTPVAPKPAQPIAAAGMTLASDIAADSPRPKVAVALRDGWAVAADLVADAGPYAPVPLVPPPVWVECGEAMPDGADAVLPLDAVNVTTTGAEALQSTAPGDGVLAAGADAAKDRVLRRAGERLRPSDVAMLQAMQIAKVLMRVPRISVFCPGVAMRSAHDAISPLLVRAVEAEGGSARLAQAASLDAALLDTNADAALCVGGTGSGRRDASVKTLARVGRVEVHGIGIAPGETAALGAVGTRPVLLVPGRLDAALAAWLVLGRRLLARLAGRVETEPASSEVLTRKVTSTVGIADIVLVRRVETGVEPIASSYFPLAAIARADGWILVPSESEGLPAGSRVELRPLP